MDSKEIRNQFLKFFESKKHEIVSAAPIVNKNDSSLMFINAGMNQFKDIFLGDKQAKSKRVVDSQPCLRVSGKHNDLEDVGKDTYHHTLFEMLGNWSFGDYFKEKAIDWAWELLIDIYKIDKNKLYVTVFGGDKSDNLDADLEARNFWKKHISEDRILNFDKKDNFWEMGATGPCGPCSEIHVDLRREEEKNKIDGIELVNKDHPEVVEIWNLVFIQYNRNHDKSLNTLPQKHIDTGMGFERLAMALQGKKSNYDTDVFVPLLNKLRDLSGKTYGKSQEIDMAFRVIVDHIRAITFIIADGQLPSNNKAGYVLRRILRRAVRYGYTFLGFEQAFLYQLIDILIEQFEDVYPQIKKQKSFIQNIIKNEEESFLNTLSNGLNRLDQIIKSSKEKRETKINGKIAFELYDTFGFPFDLTNLIALENNLIIDEKGFESEMQKQRDRARAAGKIDAGDWQIVQNLENVEFVGYDNLECQTEILKYRTVETKGKKEFQVVFSPTPFYVESGGQVGDTGYLENKLEKIKVLKTFKENNLIIHQVDKLPKEIEYFAKINRSKRKLIENNHSATHLMHAALRQVLGSHVQQKGSLVNDKYLRFDFSHFQKMTDEEIKEVETIVNQKIQANIPLLEEKNVSIEEAKAKGAIALFGEKYGEFVRVISFDPNFSVELCGGTHVDFTSQISLFKITSESSIGSGIRRIEAKTSEGAFQYFNNALEKLEAINGLFKNSKNVLHSVEKLVQENQKIQKELEKFERLNILILTKDLKDKNQNINGINLIAQSIEINSADGLKTLALEIRKQKENAVIVLGTKINDKANLVIAVSDNLVSEKNINAQNLIRLVSKEIKGGGGGQAFLATAGGKNPNGLENVYKKIEEIIKEKN